MGNRGLSRFFAWPKIDREKRLLFIAIPVLILFLAVPWPGLFFSLHVKQGRSGPALLTLPFAFRQIFYLSYTHTIYLAPVVEKLEAKGPAIHLREISTKSWAAAEYYNFPGTLHQEKGEIYIRDIQFTVAELPIIIGFTGTQRLTWKSRVYPLYELSPPGSILTFQAVSISPGMYLWIRAIK